MNKIRITGEDIATIIDSILYGEDAHFEEVLSMASEGIEAFSGTLRESGRTFTVAGNREGSKTVVTTFSARLKQALEIRNMKQNTLSEKSGVSRSLISAYLKGEYAAKLDNLSALAAALEVDQEWLLGLDVPMDR